MVRSLDRSKGGKVRVSVLCVIPLRREQRTREESLTLHHGDREEASSAAVVIRERVYLSDFEMGDADEDRCRKVIVVASTLEPRKALFHKLGHLNCWRSFVIDRERVADDDLAITPCAFVARLEACFGVTEPFRQDAMKLLEKVRCVSDLVG